MGIYFATSAGTLDCDALYDSTTTYTYGMCDINTIIGSATFRGKPIEVVEEKQEITYEEFLNL